jgi:hypothetical protein
MAYDETTYRRQSDEGATTGRLPANGIGATDYRTGAAIGAGRQRRADRRDGRPLRRATTTTGATGWASTRLGDRLLLAAAASVPALAPRSGQPEAARPGQPAGHGHAIGLLTLGGRADLRAGVPNLAVGPIALAAAVHFAENGDQGLVRRPWPALAVAAAGGIAVGVVIIALHVPGWAATLAAMLGVIVWIQLRVQPVAVQDTYDPLKVAFYLFGGFALLAVIGGALGTVQPIRRVLGRMRPHGDPARRRGAVAVLPVVGALVLSSVFAAAAGILMAAQSQAPIVPNTGLEWTGIAFGTALLAGTSAYGRRGGIFGTLLAVAGMTLFLDYINRRTWTSHCSPLRPARSAAA